MLPYDAILDFIPEPEVQPPSLPKSGDATPQPTESFVLIPPKDQDDKSQAEFDPSVDTTPLKNSDEENSFIKVQKDEEDKLPQKLGKNFAYRVVT